MIINNTRINNKNTNTTFKGPLDSAITQSLITIDTNPMVNAALVDVFSMVIPRTYVDTKERNKYAGGETLFRELTGTVIVCLSSGFIAKGIAHLFNKYNEPKTALNPNSWVTDDSFKLLRQSWDKSGNDVSKYVSNVLSNLNGVDGHKNAEWQNIDWQNVDWVDNPKWKNLNWNNPKYNNIQNSLKSDEQIINTLSSTIQDSKIDKKDAQQLLEIIDYRITNALKVGNSVNVKLGEQSLNSSVKNVVRDIYEVGKGIFTNKSINIDSAADKLFKMNKTKTLGALAIASTLGLTNQYINRKITQKRTGSDSFVGEVNYKDVVYKGKQAENKQQKSPKETSSGFVFKKLLASAGIIALAAFVMKIKNPKDFIKKLEFNGPITSGNAIKTVYTATLVGRFLASKNENELRETATRDYLGFLNWLVFGGFAAKGVANLLDKGKTDLFNIGSEGKGLKHWLNELSLKSHAEIASKGSEFAKKNIWKLNVAHASGLLYSTLALGFLIPLLNIAITKSKSKKLENQAQKFNQKLSQDGVPTVFKGIHTY